MDAETIAKGRGRPANDTIADELADAIRQTDIGGRTGLLVKRVSNGQRYVVMSWDFYQSQMEIAGRKAVAREVLLRNAGEG